MGNTFSVHIPQKVLSSMYKTAKSDPSRREKCVYVCACVCERETETERERQRQRLS